MSRYFLRTCTLLTALLVWTGVQAGETPDTIKAALTDFLARETQMGPFLNADAMVVTPTADGAFTVTLPAVAAEGRTTTPHILQLTPAGTFNDHPQYRIEPVFETVQALFHELIPEAVFSADTADINLIWVPHDNLVVTNTQKLTGLSVTLPPIFALTADRFNSDFWVRPTSNNRTDVLTNKTATALTLMTDNLRISVPNLTYADEIISCLSSYNPFIRLFSGQSASFHLALPTVLISLLPTGDTLALFHLEGTGTLADQSAHFNLRLDDITAGPALKSQGMTVIPTEARLSLEVTGFDRSALQQLAQTIDTLPEAEARDTLYRLATELVFHIREFTLANDKAAIRLTGTIRNKQDARGELYPVAEATITVKNWDTISPPPTVDEAYCQRITRQMADVPDKILAHHTIQAACSPRGGILDDFRTLLDADKRQVLPDGTTEDTLFLTLDNGLLTVNGRVIQ